MQTKPQRIYPIIALLLGAAAPVGLFLTRFLTMAGVRRHPLEDLRGNAFFYLYDFFGTSLVFAIAGAFAGLRADRYHHLAEHDSLTGLHNNRAFVDRYRRALERAVATQQPLSILLLDVDRLKAINDAFGHTVGNEALIHVADALRRSKRAADTAARWGGDEFAILLEGADVSAAVRVAEGIIAVLRNMPLLTERATTPVEVTIGICHAAQPSLDSDLFSPADRALLSGKASGRNTIEVISI